SDDSGLSDDNNDDSSNNITDPVIYYAMDNGATSTSFDDSGNNSSSDNGSGYNYGNGSGWGESSGGPNMGDSGVNSNTIETTNMDPQKENIPMQNTGIPILPAELGIISVIGGFMINRIRS
ncbi:hypothetical protein, partial [Methanobacterium sp.]|uniref:hypothetical protein n=1 Tax=Methanobacterium sp. TaxID=2164 RepID=UPI003C76F3BE